MNQNTNILTSRLSSSYCRVLMVSALMCLISYPQVSAAQSDNSDGGAINAEAVGAIVSCAVCHGPQGQGNMKMGAPRIGGLADWYLFRQLQNFRHGVRGGTDDDIYGTQMRAMSLALDDLDEAEDLAHYISTLTPEDAPQTISGNVDKGKQLYAVCTACHGADGRGNKALNAPGLRGQHDWYLIRQLDNYSSGLRGANRVDSYGQQMAPIAKTLTDEDMRDVVAYINTL